MALEELVVRFKLAVTAVIDEAVRGNECDFLTPAALETWPKKCHTKALIVQAVC
jgi:hypothetical protein